MPALRQPSRMIRPLREYDRVSPAHNSAPGLFEAYNFAAATGARSLLSGANDWTLTGGPAINANGLNTNGSSQYATQATARAVLTPPFTTLLVGRRTSGSVLWGKLRASVAWSGRYSTDLMRLNSVENVVFDGAVAAATLDASPYLQGQHCIVMVVTATRLFVAVNGLAVGEDISFTNPNTSGAQNVIGCSYINGGASNFAAGVVSLHMEWARALADEEAVEVSRNPLALLRPATRRYFLAAAAGAADTTLAGVAAGHALSQAALTAEIRLSVTAVATALAQGGVTTAIPLAGAALGFVTGGGTLATAIPLSGSGTGVASATGSLDADGAPLAADAASVTLAGGQLSAEIRFSGAALAAATAQGEISEPGEGLEATAAAAALAQAQLATSVRLDATAVAVAVAQADLSSGTTLDGVAGGTVAAAASMATAISILGGAVSVASASGTLTLPSDLSGSAASVSIADGTLTIQILLNGSAIAAALGRGTFTAGPLIALASRGYTARAGGRRWRAAAQGRRWVARFGERGRYGAGVHA